MTKSLCGLAVVALFAVGSASAQTLFAASGSNAINGTLYTINPATGAVVTTIGPIMVGATGIGITGLAFHPSNGTLYGVTTSDGNDGNTLVTINPATGAATVIGGVGALGRTVSDIAFNSAGALYGWSSPSSGSLLGTISLTTGVFTAIGASAGGAQAGGLTFGSGGTLYVVNQALPGAVLKTVNTGTGVTTNGPAITGAPQQAIDSMAANNAGTLFAVNTNRSSSPTTDNLVTINTTTGAVTNLGSLPGDIDGLAFQVSGGGGPSTPIPTTSLLVITGLGCIALYQFRAKLFGQRS